MIKIIILLITIIQCSLAREESVRVTGRLLCHGRPAQYAELQLVSEKIFGGDKFAKDIFTDPEGYFDIAGVIDHSTWTDIDARLYVWHKCYEKLYEHQDPCSMRFKLKIPHAYVSGGPLAQKGWDIGEFELKEPKSGWSWDGC